MHDTLAAPSLKHAWLNPDVEKGLFQVIFWLATALAIFQLWQGITGTLSSTYMRPIHLSWVLVLAYMKYPLIKHADSPLYVPGRMLDMLCAGLAIWCGVVTTNFDYTSLDHLLNGLQPLSTLAGTLLIFLTLEATRRSVGWVLALIGIIFLTYNMFGNLLPDAIANRGFSMERVVRFQVFTPEGIFGTPLGIAAGAVFMFVLFGAFLEISGAGKFFIDLAYAAAGKYRGGPAKATVVASAAMGSISGSSIANAVTVGSLTIPMMKKMGYKPEQAAGIEAAASTGGQIMPPIMGAGAFIMADYTNTPYSTIVLVSIIPSLLYFFCTLTYVHIIACKQGMKGMEDRPKVWPVLKDGFHFIAPLGLVTAMLLMNFSPTLTGAVGCGAVALTAALRKHTRMGFKTILTGLKSGALMALPISLACATAGLVVGVIGQTGIGLQFTEFVVSLSGGVLWLALLLIAIAALVLGMGLPVTAAYIVLAIMSAPALSQMGIPLLTAHMIIFWLSQTSNVTPPVALSAFAAAGIAGASPMRSAIEAFRLAKGYFIIPLMMAYTPLIFTEATSTFAFVSAVLATAGLIVAIAFATENYGARPLTLIERIIFTAAIPLLVYPYDTSQLIGIATVIVGLTLHMLRGKPPLLSGEGGG